MINRRAEAMMGAFSREQRRLNEALWEARINRSRAIAGMTTITGDGGRILGYRHPVPGLDPVPVASKCDRELCESRGAVCPGCPAQVVG